MATSKKKQSIACNIEDCLHNLSGEKACTLSGITVSGCKSSVSSPEDSMCASFKKNK